MLITSNMDSGDKAGINARAISLITKVANGVLDRAVNDNNDILYAPKKSNDVESFYDNVDVILTNELRQKLLKG